MSREANSPSQARMDKIVRRCVEVFELDLSGLIVFTEAASGHYLYTPIIAALAGAKKVYALTRDSNFGVKEKIRERTINEAIRFGVAGEIDVVFAKDKSQVAECDIVTNSGFVRPIDSQMVSWMKPTAVLPLMWEPWEFRSSDLDFDACKDKGILVMGTDESVPPHSMYPYAGYIAMKLLYEMGLEGFRTKTLLLGGGNGLGKSIWRHFSRLGMEVSWFSDEEEDASDYDKLRDHFITYGSTFDALILAEHKNDICLLGPSGLLTYEQIKDVNPAISVGVIAGNLDTCGLKESGLYYYPEEVKPFGFMSYQAYDLGPLPVLELYSAGLKVGQVMARARLSGATQTEAVALALTNSAAMVF